MKRGSPRPISMGIAFLCGAVAGAVAAILLAPQPGRKTLSDLERLASQGKEKIIDLAGKVGMAIDPEASRGRGPAGGEQDFGREGRGGPNRDRSRSL